MASQCFLTLCYGQVVPSSNGREQGFLTGGSMKKQVVNRIATGALIWSIGSVASGQTSMPAEESSNSPTANSQLEEITVTARKRGEDLEKVPVAISAFTGAALEDRSIHRFNELAQTTPGLVIAKQTSDPNSPAIQMRGQFQSTVQVATEPSSGVYMDGIYSGGSLGGNIGDLIDLNRVEVLKGPQGTLYGRNTTGGAINLYTNAPTDRFEGQVGVGFGNYNRRTGNFILNLPIVGDKVDLRLVGSVVTHDGYAHQLILPGINQPNVGQRNPLSEDDKSIRAALKLQPTDALQIMLRGDYSHLNDTGGANHPIYIQPTNAAVLTAAAIQMTGLPAAAITAANRAAALAKLNSAVNSDTLDVYNAFRGNTTGSTSGTSATISYDLGSVTLKSISAYRHVFSDRTIDDCGCGFDLLDFTQNGGFNMYTQELQVGGAAIDNKLKYTAGLYYFNKSGFENEYTTAFAPLKLALNPTANTYTFTDHSYAPFFQGTYALSSSFNVTGGLRYTKEKNTLTANDYNHLACQLPPANLIFPPAVLQANCRLFNEKEDSNVSYTFGIDWSPLEDFMLYAKTDRGFQAGGVNLRPNTNTASVRTYLPEVNTSYEIGSKSQWFEHRLRFNVDYYYSLLDNAQRNVLLSPTAPIVGPATLVLTNAASAKIDGVEAELSAVPFPHAFIGASAAWTHARYGRYVVGGLDQSFLKFAITPEWSAALTGSYTIPTSVGGLKSEVDWSWRSSQDLYPQDTPGAVASISATGVAKLGAGTPDSARIQGSYGLLNASLSLTIDKVDMDIRLFATNILNKRYLSFAVGTINGGTGISSGVAGDPQVFGIDLIKRF
jgi:iron complex outermembrane receptor protein